MIVDYQATDKVHSNHTGRFPVQSSHGNNYDLIAYYYGGNYIYDQALKNYQAKTNLQHGKSSTKNKKYVVLFHIHGL